MPSRLTTAARVPPLLNNYTILYPGQERLVILRRVDAGRIGLNDADFDREAGFERAELFEFFEFFKQRGGKIFVTEQKRAAVGVEAEVMVAVNGFAVEHP